MRRREFLGVLGGVAAAWPVVARAQQSEPMRRVGFLRVGPPPPAFIDGFRQGMRERGLIEGQHFVIEYGLAISAAQIPDVATELVTRRLDVLVASGTPSVAAKECGISRPSLCGFSWRKLLWTSSSLRF
jgi:putative tryptophan/tyrosine transport system substrate-binding protein